MNLKIIHFQALLLWKMIHLAMPLFLMILRQKILLLALMIQSLTPDDYSINGDDDPFAMDNLGTEDNGTLSADDPFAGLIHLLVTILLKWIMQIHLETLELLLPKKTHLVMLGMHLIRAQFQMQWIQDPFADVVPSGMGK